MAEPLEQANPNNCPYCGGSNGFHTKEIVDFKNYWEWNGEHIEGVHTNGIRGGKVFYCSDCGKNITSHINKPEGY